MSVCSARVLATLSSAGVFSVQYLSTTHLSLLPRAHLSSASPTPKNNKPQVHVVVPRAVGFLSNIVVFSDEFRGRRTGPERSTERSCPPQGLWRRQVCHLAVESHQKKGSNSVKARRRHYTKKENWSEPELRLRSSVVFDVILDCRAMHHHPPSNLVVGTRWLA